MKIFLVMAGILAAAGLCPGQTDLFEAARAGDLPRLRSLAVDRKLVDLRDTNGQTALHETVASCHPEAARILIDAGWNRTLADSQNRTPLTLASQCPKDTQALFRAILAPPVPENFPWSLQYAAGHHQVNVVSMLLNMRVDTNALGSDGNRALDLSVLRGDARITQLLLEHGADPKLRNKTGATPLHDAALSGNKDVVDLLVAHGADINAVDGESRSTPLHYAAEFDRLDAARALVRHGADVNLKNAAALTVLQVAAKNGFDDVSQFLATAAKR